MRDRDLDDLLNRAAGAPPGVDPSVLDRIAQSVGASLQPVRPLPPSWLLVGGLMLIGAGVAGAGGVILGLHGLERLSAAGIRLIFPLLAVLVWLAAAISVNRMVPGSPRRIAPWMFAVAGSVALLAIFALVFDDYRVHRFVPSGLTCLTAGLLLAIPAALAGWLLLRRGFAVDSVAAGWAQGALAGLAGLAMLELHCPNFEAPHVMVWHTAVLPLSAAAGALLAWARRARPRLPA